jgi:hypothetical protein
MKNKFTLSVMVMMVFVFLVGACTSTQPTIDPNIVYTEAAKTVAAELTSEVPPTAPPTATAPPTNTPVPPTNTPTMEPPTETPLPTATADNAAASTPTPTWQAGNDELIDEALFTVYYPPVDQRYTSGGVFNAQVGFQNVGPNTWNSGYSMRFLSGTDFGVGGKYTLDEFGSVTTVAPGEEVVITIPNMKAPQEEGTYISNWCFYNNREDQGLRPQCFFLVSFQIIVRND